MTFDELRPAWRRHSESGSITPQDREAIISRVCRHAERLNGRLVRRDLIETGAAIAVVFFFGGFFLQSDNVAAKAGAAIVVAGAVLIMYKLYRTRAIQKPAPIDAPIQEFCRTEAERLDRQVHLGRSVLWWYIAPCIVGVNVLFTGVNGFGIASAVYCAVTLVVAAGIYVLNQRAVSKSLVPARRELARLLEDLNEASQTQ